MKLASRKTPGVRSPDPWQETLYMAPVNVTIMQSMNVSCGNYLEYNQEGFTP